jgi:cellulose synthase/poly-beta-1,6-N-acetylglucosamine synthase-like glycosyltransferase
VIIQILSNLREEGYLERSHHPTVAPFFAGANVAFRRTALRDAGSFDPDCRTGEDCDLCARLSKERWELYVRRSAIVYHSNPTTLRHLMRQWYGYGLYHPYVFSKHNARAVEIFGRLGRPIRGERYACLFYRLFPLAVVVFLTPFLFLHLAAAVTAALLFFGLATAGLLSLFVTGLLGLAYMWPDVKRFGCVRGAALTGVRYIADLTLFVGAFIGGLRKRMIYVSATVD